MSSLLVAQINREPSNDSHTVRGTVVNRVTGEPIARALVASPDNRLAAMTDDYGRFEFTVPGLGNQAPPQSRVFSTNRFATPPPIYSVSARKPGFLQYPEGAATALQPDLVLSLLPEGIIHGRVSTGNAEPAGGIVVQLFKHSVQEGLQRWLPSGNTRANSNGEFRFAELLPGEYKLMTQELLDADPADVIPGGQVYGFPPVCFPGMPDFASGATITITPGQSTEADIPISRQPYFNVKLPVIHAESSPGLIIEVQAMSHPGPGYSLGYNPGTHAIEGLLPNGTYLIKAQGFGPTASSGQVSMTITGHAVMSPSLALTSAAVIPVDVHEEFTSEWHGSTTFYTGPRSITVPSGPRSYLNISLERVEDFSVGPPPTLRAPSSPNDALVIENVVPGSYWVRFNTSRGYVQSVNSNGVDLLHQPLVILSGSPAAIDITMRDDAAQLSGTINGLAAESAEHSSTVQGPSAPPAFIYCVPTRDSTGTYLQFTAAQDGNFQSPPMPPGSYRLFAFAEPNLNLPYRDAAAMRAYENQGQLVNLVPGQTEHLQLQLARSNEQ